MPRRPPRLTLFPYTTLFRSSRGNKGFVAINREGGTLARTFTTGLPDGHYRNVAGDGSCVTVQGGQVSLSVAPMEAAALHVGAACDGNDGSDEGNNGNGSDAEQASVAFQCSKDRKSVV